MSSEGGRDRSLEYLDLLAATLTQHEKTLDSLIEKLEKAAATLVKSSRQAKETTSDEKETDDVLVYTTIEIPFNRPVDELTKLLDALSARSRRRQ